MRKEGIYTLFETLSEKNYLRQVTGYKLNPDTFIGRCVIIPKNL